MKDHFLSCDWGTSSFRLKLVSVHDLQVVGEENSKKGISSTFNEWEQKNNTDQHRRQSFYLNVIAEHVRKLESKLDLSLDNVPVVLSGMASSTIGIISIPYTDVPFSVSGDGLNTYLIKAGEDFPHDVLIISGAKTDVDVMRGEETQLIGCFEEENINVAGEQTFIFPGTHSKHILVKEDKVVDFTTYMTGEFFDLLSNHSILHVAVKKHADNEAVSESFMEGVRTAVNNNLLHNAFMARTNDLFAKLTKEQNYDYLSGLLIGTELKDLQHVRTDIFLCCNSNLEKYYSSALTALGLNEKVKMFAPGMVDSSVIKGQLKILQNIGLDHG